MAHLLYGSGLRVMECVRLRIKDVDLGYLQITLRDGKGGRDRRTMVPVFLVDALRKQIAKVAELHREDLSAGAGEVNLPFALSRKFPSAARELGWQYLFPASRRTIVEWTPERVRKLRDRWQGNRDWWRSFTPEEQRRRNEAYWAFVRNRRE